MRNIAFVALNLSNVGGVEKITIQLANELSKYYDIHLISILNGENTINFDLNERIQFVALNPKIKRMREYLFESVLKIKRYCNEKNIKIVFFEGEGSAVIGAILSKVSSVYCIFCDHGAMNYLIKNKSQNRSNFRLLKFCVRMCDKTIVLTDRTKDKFIREFDVSSNKIVKINNFFDDKFVSNSYNNTSKKILTVGRLDEGKGLDLLFEIAKKIKTRTKDWEWHIYGSGNLQEFCQMQIEKNGLQNQVILKGESTELYKIYSKYCLFVFTSQHEGLPMVLLEARAAKLPIVSFDIDTGPSEIVKDKENGKLINAFDCEDMANTIVELLHNDNLRIEYSNHAHCDLEKFSKNTVIEHWCKLIEEI